MNDSLLVDVADGVMTLTINRADKRNAIDRAVLDGLAGRARAGPARPRRSGSSSCGGPGGYFSAGIDLPYAMNPGMARLDFMRMVGERPSPSTGCPCRASA